MLTVFCILALFALFGAMWSLYTPASDKRLGVAVLLLTIIELLRCLPLGN